MGIVEDSQTIGPDVDDLFQGLLKTFEGLEGKAIDEIQVDAPEAQIPGPLHGLTGDFLGLDPVDSPLDLFIEVLDPHGKAVESSALESLQMFPGETTWVDLAACLQFFFLIGK